MATDFRFTGSRPTKVGADTAGLRLDWLFILGHILLAPLLSALHAGVFRGFCCPRGLQEVMQLGSEKKDP